MASEPTIYRVPKRCPCGATWEGNSFSPSKGEPQVALCEACLDKDAFEVGQTEVQRRQGIVREAAVTDVKPPERAGQPEGVIDILSRLPPSARGETRRDD